ncbi:MAG: transposase [Patescibacteria group bacterium]
MRKVSPAPGEYYHIYNRGTNKQVIFLDERDWARFMFLIIYLQSPVVSFNNAGRHVSSYIKNSTFNVTQKDIEEIVKTRSVELINFALMPNHFHLMVHELKENGISNYMHRVSTAYTNYFNIKYERSGHLTQGPYKAVCVSGNDQLLYLSAYIHRNPREIKMWTNKEHEYPWSSYQDCVGKNRWGDLLKPEIILEQFSSKEDYHKFVKTNPAKLFDQEKEEGNSNC